MIMSSNLILFYFFERENFLLIINFLIFFYLSVEKTNVLFVAISKYNFVLNFFNFRYVRFYFIIKTI